MHLRRNTALALGALALTVPALSSCGFDYATDQVNTIAMVENERSAVVDVVGATIVAERDGSGTFLANFANGSEEPAAVETIEGGADGALEVGEFRPIELAPGGGISLSFAGKGVRVTGDFEIGDFVPLTVGFANGEQVELSVPVVPACGEYEGYDDAPAAGGAAPTGEPYECGVAEGESAH